MKKHIAMIIFALCFLAGCAATPHWDEFMVHPNNVYVEPRPDKALVYFYKESCIDLVTYYVRDNDKIIGAAGCGFYFFYHANPGEHFFWAETEVKRFLTLKLEAGKTYFVQMSWAFGLLVAHPVLEIVPEQIGYPAIKTMKYATLKESQQ